MEHNGIEMVACLECFKGWHFDFVIRGNVAGNIATEGDVDIQGGNNLVGIMVPLVVGFVFKGREGDALDLFNIEDGQELEADELHLACGLVFGQFRLDNVGSLLAFDRTAKVADLVEGQPAGISIGRQAEDKCIDSMVGSV